MDWHREFLRDYADCTYTRTEYVEQGDTVCVRADIEAKGYDWRPFVQRVIEVMRFDEGLVAERRLYGMLRDIELDKPSTKALDDALEFRGGNANETRKATETLFNALLTGDLEPAKEVVAEKAVLIDGVYGLAAGLDNIGALFAAVPRPAFGITRVTGVVAGPKDAAVEIAVDPAQPRAAYWIRMVEGKIAVIEGYWMLRDIGVEARQNYARDRHMRQVIMPI
jgi:ketosteroid isomerase-like protein